MPESLTTYDVAAFIHDAVWLRNSALTEELLADSRLYATHGDTSRVELVICNGDGEPTEPIFETLSRGRNGLYYFQATAGIRYTGRLPLDRCVITPRDRAEIAECFARSMIVREFVRITKDI
jgi:hypothetical protein